MFPLLLLAIESQNVIALRTLKMFAGDLDPISELQMMIEEKADAAIEAGTSLMAGSTVGSVVDRYREHVAANAARLG